METERAFSFGGQRRLARPERLEAGFTVEELDEIEQVTAELAKKGGGPRRQTLFAAAELVRDRHQARLRGETPAPIEIERAAQA